MIELKSNPVTPIIQVHAVMNFWLACHNIEKHSLINNCFSDHPAHIQRHLFKKFVEDCRCDLMSFVGVLDVKMRRELIEYVLKTYKGIGAKEIEEKYFAQ